MITPLSCALLPHGVALHYVERGEGPPVVLLHGGMGDCRSWAAQLEPLASRFRVISFSRRHSSPNRNADPGAAHRLVDDVDDLAALLEWLHVPKAHFIGTSYGALVALAFSLRRRDEVTSLVLCEPPLHAWACETPAGAVLYRRFLSQAWSPARAAFESGDDARATQLLVDGMADAPVHGGMTRERKASARRNAGAMRALVRSAEPFPDLPREEVAALAMPVLLLQGQHTSALHAASMDALARSLPAARREAIAASRHTAPNDNPAAFNAAVLPFLGKAAAALR